MATAIHLSRCLLGGAIRTRDRRGAPRRSRNVFCVGVRILAQAVYCRITPMKTLPATTDVVIVGAGPTGLSLACVLAR